MTHNSYDCRNIGTILSILNGSTFQYHQVNTGKLKESFLCIFIRHNSSETVACYWTWGVKIKNIVLSIRMAMSHVVNCLTLIQTSRSFSWNLNTLLPYIKKLVSECRANEHHCLFIAFILKYAQLNNHLMKPENNLPRH